MIDTVRHLVDNGIKWRARPPASRRDHGCMPSSPAGGMQGWWPSCTTGCAKPSAQLRAEVRSRPGRGGLAVGEGGRHRLLTPRGVSTLGRRRVAELGAGPDEEAAEVAPSEALRLVLTAPVLPQSVDQPRPGLRLEAAHAHHGQTARFPGRGPSRGRAADPAQSWPAAASSTAQPRPRRRSTHPGMHLHRVVVPLDRPPGRLLPGPAVPLQQQPGALDRVRDVKQPADQRLDSRQGPPLVRPAVRERTTPAPAPAAPPGPAPASGTPASPPRVPLSVI